MTVPPILSRLPDGRGLSLLGRLLAGGMALACLTVLIVAAMVPPDASGANTHVRIGLRPCQFLARTNIPCPSCGMTTSFAYFAHGNLAASVYVQPMGFILAVLATCVFWLGLYEAVSGASLHRLLLFTPATYYWIAAAVLTAAAWGWKIWIHAYGRDGW